MLRIRLLKEALHSFESHQAYKAQNSPEASYRLFFRTQKPENRSPESRRVKVKEFEMTSSVDPQTFDS